MMESAKVLSKGAIIPCRLPNRNCAILRRKSAWISSALRRATGSRTFRRKSIPFPLRPEAKTVIVMGKRITRGTLRGTEEGTNFSDYNLFGIQWLDMDYVAEGCYNLVRYIEDRGWEAVPVFSNPSAVAGYGVPVRDGAPVPDVIPDFNYAAVACGLGVIGVNGLFLSKKYGPRQKLQMIITDAEFESDPLVTQTICDQCRQLPARLPAGRDFPGNHPPGCVRPENARGRSGCQLVPHVQKRRDGQPRIQPRRA